VTRPPVIWMGKTHCRQVEISADRWWMGKTWRREIVFPQSQILSVMPWKRSVFSGNKAHHNGTTRQVRTWDYELAFLCLPKTCNWQKV